jgi:predicted AAA+ superfamily ATPase
MWIPRLHENTINKAVAQRPSVLLTGARQTGKSSLLKQMFPDYTYVTLDRMLMASEAQESPDMFLKRFQGPVIIDEIQYAPNLFRELKICIDEQRQEKGRWILTGSQQFSLMQRVSESLAGRVRIVSLNTLSSMEIRQSGFFSKDQLEEYLVRGGYPELWADLSLDANDFFDDYIQTYLERDLRTILNIKGLRDFQRLIQICALRAGQLLNYSDMSRDLGVSVNTVKSWISALEAGDLIHMLPPYFGNIGKRLVKSPKLFFADHGLLCHLLRISSLDDYRNSPHKGAVWENLVYSELIKARYKPGKELFHYRDQNGVEVDFVIEHSDNLELIEAKATESPDFSRTNLASVARVFSDRSVVCKIASPVQSDANLRDYGVYNPLGYY